MRTLPLLFLDPVVAHVSRALFLLPRRRSKIFQLTGGLTELLVGVMSVKPLLTREALPDPAQESIGCEAKNSKYRIGFIDTAPVSPGELVVSSHRFTEKIKPPAPPVA